MENWNACWRSLEIFLQSIRQLARFLSSQRAAGMHPFSDRILRTSLCQGSHSKSKHLYLTTWNKVLKSVIQKMAADGNELWRERVQFSKSELNNVSILQEIILRPPSFCGDQAVAHGPLVHGPRSMY